MTTYSVVFFLPTILKQLGWTSIRAQVMSIPVFIVAAIVTITSAVLSDHFKKRYIFLMSGCILAIIGYAILFSMKTVPVGVRYFAVYLMTSGGFSAQTIGIVWLANNMGGHYKRAIGVAMQVSTCSSPCACFCSNSDTIVIGWIRQYRRHYCQFHLPPT